MWLLPLYHLVSDHVVRLSIAKWGEGSHLGLMLTPILNCENHFLDCIRLLALSLQNKA